MIKVTRNTKDEPICELRGNVMELSIEIIAAVDSYMTAFIREESAEDFLKDFTQGIKDYRAIRTTTVTNVTNLDQILGGDKS